ncbi:hypothetical protein GGF50DRAFT_121314 [Schizophyllum commune]
MSPGVSRGEKFANRRELRRGSRGNPSLKAVTQGEGGEGREAARSAAGDAGNAKPSSSASSSHELRKSTRLYLLPRPVNIFTRRFHVASSAPLDHFLEIHAPLSLKQRIAVRRARVPLALNVSLLCPSPHMRPPSLYRVAPHPLGVEATSFSFSLDCTTLLVLQFATLFELAAPPATPSILVSNNFNTPRGLGADAHPSNVADVKGISSALPRAPFSTPRGR